MLTSKSLLIDDFFQIIFKIINPIFIESMESGRVWSDESDKISVFKEFLSISGEAKEQIKQ